MFNRRAVALSLILSLLCLAAPSNTRAQETDINARIRKEGMEQSEIMKTLHVLSDVYGPRYTWRFCFWTTGSCEGAAGYSCAV